MMGAGKKSLSQRTGNTQREEHETIPRGSTRSRPWRATSPRPRCHSDRPGTARPPVIPTEQTLPARPCLPPRPRRSLRETILGGWVQTNPGIEA